MQLFEEMIIHLPELNCEMFSILKTYKYIMEVILGIQMDVFWLGARNAMILLVVLVLQCVLSIQFSIIRLVQYL